MLDLKQIAEQAQKDARRAEALRAAIQTIGENHDGTLFRIDIDFMVPNRTGEASEEVARTVKRMWPTIWEETMRVAADELQQIEARYAPLMVEAAKDG